MRADARQNREQILLAARDVFIDLGPDAPLEEIARRAGVGIATLYRRFPDRQALLRAVALDVLARVAHEARSALAEEATAFQALARYMHRALDLRVGAVLPALVGHTSFEDEAVLGVRDEAAAIVEAMIRGAQAQGALRTDVTFGDIGLLVIRLTRPLLGSFPRALDERLAHRQLDLVIDGLRGVRDPASSPLSGPALTLHDLRVMSPSGSNAPAGSDAQVSGSASAPSGRDAEPTPTSPNTTTVPTDARGPRGSVPRG